MNELFEKLLSGLTEQGLITESKEQEFKQLFDTASSKLRVMALTEAKEAVDAEYQEAVDTLVESIDVSNTANLKQLIESYDNKIAAQAVSNKKAIKFATARAMVEANAELEDTLDVFLDTYIEEATPASVVVDYNRMEQLEQMFESLKTTLVINDKYVQNEVKAGIMDGAQMIESRDSEIDRLALENTRMVMKISKLEATSLLEQKTTNTSPKLKLFMSRLFEDASASTIEDTFVEALDAFNKQEAGFRNIVAEEVSKKVIPKKPILEEVAKPIKQNDLMSQYVSAIKQSTTLTRN